MVELLIYGLLVGFVMVPLSIAIAYWWISDERDEKLDMDLTP